MHCCHIRKLINFVVVTTLLISLTAWPGCGAVPMGFEDITLSATKLTPGKFLTISHSSIVVDSRVTIEFERDDGFLVSVVGIDTEDGLVRVAVPALIDLSTGQFQPGDVMVSIVGIDSRRSLMVDELLQLEDIEPGTVLRLFLEAAITDYQSLLTNMGTLSADLGTSIDSTNATTAINAAIQELQAQLSELDTSGELVVTLPDGTTTALGAEELAMADRLLVSMLAGVSSSISNSAKSSSTNNQKDIVDDCIKGTSNAADRIQCLKDVLGEIRVDTGKGTNLASMLATGVGLVVTVFGVVISAPEIAVTGLIVAVVSAATSLGNAAVNNQNSDSFLNNNRQGFDASQESASQIFRVGAEVAGNLPGPVGATSTAVNIGIAVNDLYNGAESVKCDGTQKNFANQQTSGNVSGFCPVTQPPADDGTGIDDTPSAGSFTIIGFTNTDGFISGALPANTSQAQIRISGNPARPTFSWTGVNDVFSLVVTSSTLSGSVTLLYGLEGETPPDENGDTEQIAFGFTSVNYGTFGLTNTVPQGGISGPLGPADAVSLTSELIVSVSVFTLNGEFATTTFQVN